VEHLAPVNKYRDLVAWQRCRELAREVYRVTKGFPSDERYGLSAQVRRAAVSAVANIAEGYARYGRAELAHALSIALGTLAEVDALLQVARDLGYLTPEEHERLTMVRDEASRVTFSLQRAIRR
jgi:four helix bundle protein